MPTTSNMTAEIEKVRELSKRLRIKADIIQMGERIAFGSDSEIMREAAATLDTIIAKQKATEEALRVAVEGLQDIADVKQHEVESCAYARYYLAKINTILKEPTE